MSLGVLAQSLWRRLVGGPQAIFTISMPDRGRIKELATLLQDDVLQPILGERFPLEAIAQAHAAAERDRHRSTVVEVARPADAAVA
jgi:NADPH:quinone reductase-like Zn-dependent oxidoreductase